MVVDAKLLDNSPLPEELATNSSLNLERKSYISSRARELAAVQAITPQTIINSK